MNRKKLNTSALVNELQGASVFFYPTEKTNTPTPEAIQAASPPTPVPEALPHKAEAAAEAQQPADTVTPRYHDTVISRHPDGVKPRVSPDFHRDLYDEALIDQVVEEVKQVGSFAATYRFTQAEKSRLGMTVFNLLSGGVRVSENELLRIALNFLLDCLEEGLSPHATSPFAAAVKRLKLPKS